MSPPLPILSRREMLRRTACGFGSLALAGLCNRVGAGIAGNPLAARQPHFAPRAKRVIFLFMQGGPSHVDTFDHKPELIRNHMKEVDILGYRFNDFRKMTKRTMLKPFWEFRRHGRSGLPVSALFPETARHVDKLCFLHGMHTEGIAHGPSTLFLHTGSVNLIRPSVGSWISYGLGSENENMPAFVTIMPTARMGGPQNYGNAFLPSIHQGTAIGKAGQTMDQVRISHTANARMTRATQERQFGLMQDLNRIQTDHSGGQDEIDASIKAYELAFRMQSVAPEFTGISGESEAVKSIYGIGEKFTDSFGRQCLMARRLAESGVRYIQVNYSDNDGGNPRWDQHSDMPAHATHARRVDKPIAGLLQDLESRGLLEDTLVWWGGEFGRTPFSQNGNGRDHNSKGFTVWLAGGGVRPGTAYGATDEWGYKAVDGKMHMHDLHATILHLLGLDHERLTYRHAGRDFRLTDVYGEVTRGIIA